MPGVPRTFGQDCSYKSNLSTISLSVIAEFSSLFLVLALYVDKDDTFNVECEKRIKWSYFGEEESFNTDDFEQKHMHYRRRSPSGVQMLTLFRYDPNPDS